jgi:phage shock protein A
MVDQDAPDPQFDAMTARLLRREALRRAAEELNTTSGPGLEEVLARIAAEVTAEAAACRHAAAAGNGKVGATDATDATPVRKLPRHG